MIGRGWKGKTKFVALNATKSLQGRGGSTTLFDDPANAADPKISLVRASYRWKVLITP
jgi:hypothetical protein